MQIRSLVISDVEQTSQLIEEVSNDLNQNDFSQQGYINFKHKVLHEGLRKNMSEGFKYWGAFEDEMLIGMIAIKPPTHLFNLFVHKDHHGKGIARKLWDYILSRVSPTEVTVFSSTHAVGFYERLGFVHSGEKIESDDIICYPMLWSKP